MTQIAIVRWCYPIARHLFPLSSKRTVYLGTIRFADGLLAATFPLREPRLWWYLRRIYRAAESGQTVIEA